MNVDLTPPMRRRLTFIAEALGYPGPEVLAEVIIDSWLQTMKGFPGYHENIGIDRPVDASMYGAPSLRAAVNAILLGEATITSAGGSDAHVVWKEDDGRILSKDSYGNLFQVVDEHLGIREWSWACLEAGNPVT